MDPRGYDPDSYRQRRDGVPYGEPSLALEQWEYQQARSLWGRARRAWHDEHGSWPGGLTPLDLLRKEVAARRRPAAVRPCAGDDGRRVAAVASAPLAVGR